MRAPVLDARFRSAERGFTLAGLLVILTVISVIVAFTVPRLWSSIMQRERDKQTIFVMKQYARAISDYQRLRGALPTKLEQLTEQKTPRIIRQLWVNPQSGELDWIIVPAGTATPAMASQAPVAQGGAPTSVLPQSGSQPQNPQQGKNPKEFTGPFIGVRPPQTGPSFLELEGQKTYETWMYTLNELERDQKVTAPGPQVPQGAGPTPSRP